MGQQASPVALAYLNDHNVRHRYSLKWLTISGKYLEKVSQINKTLLAYKRFHYA